MKQTAAEFFKNASQNFDQTSAHKSSWLHLMSENAKVFLHTYLPKIVVNNGKKTGPKHKEWTPDSLSFCEQNRPNSKSIRILQFDYTIDFENI